MISVPKWNKSEQKKYDILLQGRLVAGSLRLWWRNPGSEPGAVLELISEL